MLSFSEMHQFLRVPVLIQHFIEHRQLDPSVSLLSFLNEHYIHQYVRDADYQRDNQLPFRHADCCAVTTAINCECPAMTFIELPVRSTETKTEFVLLDEESHTLLSIADIFQPPRCA
ncbi:MULTISPECIES: hypothetical protein [Niastella]|uniref:Uncharacterized protein n=1 Tax=Niastella soli TaxID=2821487 RepID=A0ABS3Z4G1_9BACT|nr:hypothetical protein [Niastella soli]MBO9205052.1 hypothetical protein [Niastella soli]